MTSSVQRLIKDWVDAAIAQGWQVSLTGGNHWRLLPPTGRPVMLPNSPRKGSRNVRNLRAELKRAGLKV